MHVLLPWLQDLQLHVTSPVFCSRNYSHSGKYGKELAGFIAGVKQH